MDIKLKEMGESFYNPFLAPLVKELTEAGHAVEDQGAMCIFVGKKKGPPLMIQKSDGGFGYATTDLAALRYRVNEFKADRIVYVTDVGQELHFKQVFEAGEKCGLYDPTVTQLNHMMFGMVLQETVTIDENGKEVRKQEKIKTRAGKTVKLIDLLDEARDRALQTFQDRIKSQQDSETNTVKVQIESQEDMLAAAEVLGISSIKYYDLKQNRTQNYCFDFDKMLDPKGNTGVYLIYAYVRIMSILRKAGYDESMSDLHQFTVSNEWERALAMTILRLPEALEAAAKELMVNRLTDYLYEISNKTNDFYNNSKVIGSEEQNSRLALLSATTKVMKLCFDLLGMQTIERI